jgi:hypothetical protein
MAAISAHATGGSAFIRCASHENRWERLARASVVGEALAASAFSPELRDVSE